MSDNVPITKVKKKLGNCERHNVQSFIDQKIDKYSRNFSDKEIKLWEKEDILTKDEMSKRDLDAENVL